MKKKLLNTPIFLIVVLLLGIAFFTFGFIMSWRDPRYQEISQKVAILGSLGLITIFEFVVLLLIFELIYIYEDKVVSVKIFKRTEIFYNETVSIRNAHKDLGIGSYPSYEISDSSKNKIEIISSKKRDKIVEEIKSKINLAEDGQSL